MSYTPLHTHTEYSLLDGSLRLKELFPRLKELGIESCAISDHGWMAGCIAFYKEAIKQEIKPLIGVEAYVTVNPDGLENKEKTKDNAHLVLIAKNNEGLRKLFHAVSNAALNNFYYKSRIYRENLKELAPDVIVSSACLKSPLSIRARYVFDENEVCTDCFDHDGSVEGELDWFLSVFGEDFYLELQDSPAPDQLQEHYNKLLLWLGKKKGAPFVITSDAHYLTKEDHSLHELMVAMQLGKTIQEYKAEGKMVYSNNYYIKSPEEMKKSAEELGVPEALQNTLDIAEKCNVEIELGKYQFPDFPLKDAPDYQEFLIWNKKRKNAIQKSENS